MARGGQRCHSCQRRGAAVAGRRALKVRMAGLQKERRKLGRSAEPASREQRKALGRRILLARQSLRGAGKGPATADSAAALQLGALDVAGLAGDEDPPFASALGASATAGGVSGMDTS